MSDYNDPPWARKPQAENSNGYSPPSASSMSTCEHEWFLLEIKSGVQLDRHTLSDRPCTVLGRAADQVHICLQHESCSRQHARIAFDSSGTPWLRDLQSTHGTQVNKKPLPQQTIGRVESNSTKPGSRGVVLYPGDLIQFGASTRLFCVEGPEEFSKERVMLRKQQQELQRKQQQAEQLQLSSETDDDMGGLQAQTESRQDDDGGVSWGISMDDDPTENDASATEHSGRLPLDLDESSIPEKHRREWELLKALRHRLENIRTESERIRRKGISNLTEGQERQLERNQEKEEALLDDIKTAESQLFSKLYPDKHQQSKKKRKELDAYQDDEEEVDDRTGDTPASLLARVVPELNEDGETEASLTRKWKLLLDQNEGINAEVEVAQERLQKAETRFSNLLAAGDEEEAFFARNDVDLAKDAVNKLTTEKETLLESTKEMERLLLICNPKLTIDRDSAYVGVAPLLQAQAIFPGSMGPPMSRSNLLDPPVCLPKPPPVSTEEELMEEEENEREKTKFMPPPKPVHRLSPSHTTSTSPPPSVTQEEAPTLSASDISMPPPKRKRVIGPAMPPPPFVDGSVNAAVPGLSCSRSHTPPQGTLAAIARASSAPPPTSEGASTRSREKNPKISTVAPKVIPAKPVDQKTDLWQRPADQDGSGRTKLNEKFAGRY